jgi:BRCA1-associated RING domain protein 1
VYLVGDDIFNMEKEISRSSRLKCSRCKLPGAALGCYHHPCPKNYHVPCAVMIPECRWDMVSFLVDIVIKSILKTL